MRSWLDRMSLNPPLAPARPTVVTMRSPGEIASAIPFLVGFAPHESAVLVALRGKRMGLTCRVDLADLDHDDALASIVGAVVRDRATAVILTAFGAERSATARALARLRDPLLDAGLAIAEELSVVDGRWFHETCPRRRCCPPEGTAVADHDIAPSTMALSAAMGGYRADRESATADCRPDRPALTELIKGEPLHLPEEDLEGPALVEEIVAVLGWGEHDDEPSPGQLARAALRMRVPGVRDLWYALVAPGMMLEQRPELDELHRILCAVGSSAGDLSSDGVLLDREARERVLERLLTWVRNQPDDRPELSMHPLVVAAMAFWCAGDGTRARVLVERASRLDAPVPGMLDTLQRCLTHGVRPPELGWLAPEVSHHWRMKRREERISRNRRRSRRGRRGSAA